MKTVIDAVNEFKGETDGNYIYVGASSNDINKGNLQETYTTIHNEKWWLLCTRDQFNDLVSQMETNFGKCPADVIYDYKSNKKELLTPSPQPYLTYTQAMADNGELPSVGMEFIYRDSTNTKNNAVVTYVSEWNVVFRCLDDGFSQGVELAKEISGLNIARQILPLTPPITLENGKAYQFDCDQLTYVGFYRELRKSFFTCLVSGNKICSNTEATNIQPLTVEVK